MIWYDFNFLRLQDPEMMNYSTQLLTFQTFLSSYIILHILLPFIPQRLQVPPFDDIINVWLSAYRNKNFKYWLYFNLLSN